MRTDNPGARVRLVHGDYFGTLRLPIREGRALAASDAEGALPVAVVNERLAREFWPGRSPIGERLSFGWTDEPHWMTIVGVAGRPQGHAGHRPGLADGLRALRPAHHRLAALGHPRRAHAGRSPHADAAAEGGGLVGRPDADPRPGGDGRGAARRADRPAALQRAGARLPSPRWRCWSRCRASTRSWPTRSRSGGARSACAWRSAPPAATCCAWCSAGACVSRRSGLAVGLVPRVLARAHAREPALRGGAHGRPHLPGRGRAARRDGARRLHAAGLARVPCRSHRRPQIGVRRCIATSRPWWRTTSGS